ncbi:MAG TPA: BrxA/BrxB family bacilliredoxin [Fibrobacteria bacterium]|nr:BrxA/BrxB family bacilliredoxin [Fibrobacteria bacterium]
MYDEEMIAPMREELTALGIRETRTAEEVEEVIAAKGTTLVVVNSVCGCAAAQARPGVAEAFRKAAKKPDHAITVFAGNDREATAAARAHFVGYQPSSPSIALLKDGDVVFMLERYQISGRDAQQIGRDLADALNAHC